MPNYMANNGINMIGDIAHQNGNILAIQEMKDKYDLPINAFDFYRVRALVQTFVKNFKDGLNLYICRPCLDLLAYIVIPLQSGKCSHNSASCKLIQLTKKPH